MSIHYTPLNNLRTAVDGKPRGARKGTADLPVTDTSPTVLLLMEALKDPTAVVVCQAARQLGRLGRGAGAAADVLTRLLTGRTEAIRAAAAEALRQIVMDVVE